MYGPTPAPAPASAISYTLSNLGVRRIQDRKNPVGTLRCYHRSIARGNTDIAENELAYVSYYYRSYSEFCNRNMNIQLQIIKDHISHYPVIEDLIGFHYWLNDKVAQIYEKDPDYAKQHVTELFIHTTFSHNVLSFYTIFSALEQNMIQQSKMIIRNIIESIPKIFYLSFYPNDFTNIVSRDVILWVKSPEERETRLKEFYDTTKLDVFRDIDPKRVIEYVERKYYFKWFTERVYDEATTQSMEKLHRDLSQSTHSNFMKPQPKYDKETTHKMLRDMEILLFYNLVAEIEGHKEMIKAGQFPMQESNAFLERIRAALVTNGELANLFPNHPDIASKVFVHPPGPPWD